MRRASDSPGRRKAAGVRPGREPMARSGSGLAHRDHCWFSWSFDRLACMASRVHRSGGIGSTMHRR